MYWWRSRPSGPVSSLIFCSFDKLLPPRACFTLSISTTSSTSARLDPLNLPACRALFSRVSREETCASSKLVALMLRSAHHFFSCTVLFRLSVRPGSLRSWKLSSRAALFSSYSRCMVSTMSRSTFQPTRFIWSVSCWYLSSFSCKIRANFSASSRDSFAS